MCLAVPGRLLSVMGDDPVMRIGRVDFGGIVKEINLAFVPEARVDDYVLVHVGFALDRDRRERSRAGLRGICARWANCWRPKRTVSREGSHEVS